ncbi:MAG: hypothetical protein U9Q66_01385 [Patescibacteria group bacterium]|nr:hypothetical protein [Patescibacteria group bacterium]
MNFGAYKSIALSYLDKDSMEQSSQKLLTAIDISEIETSNKKEVIVDLEKKKIEEIKQYNKEKQLRNKIENEKETTTDIEENKTFHAMKKLLYKTNSENIDFNINIAPYENRIIIPKIGKNIPLLDVDNKNIEKSKDLE